MLPSTLWLICDKTFFKCKNLRKVTFGEESKLRTVGAFAFSRCVRLIDVVFPEGLERVGSSAFKESGLEKITLPRTIKEVGRDVFSECSNLTIYIQDDCEVNLSDD